MERDVERLLRNAQRSRDRVAHHELASFFRVSSWQLGELTRLDGFPSPSMASGQPTWDAVELRRWRVNDWMETANRAFNDSQWRTPPLPSEYRGRPLSCSFCRREQADVRRLIAGPAVAICTDCVEDADGAIGYPDSFEVWRRTVLAPSWLASETPSDSEDRDDRLRRLWDASKRLHLAVLDRGYLLLRDLPDFLGQPAVLCRELSRREGFPAPVKIVGEQRMWLRSDVERWSGNANRAP